MHNTALRYPIILRNTTLWLKAGGKKERHLGQHRRLRKGIIPETFCNCGPGQVSAIICYISLCRTKFYWDSNVGALRAWRATRLHTYTHTHTHTFPRRRPQGLKSHAVTMFEVGKLTDESMDSFLAQLDKVGCLTAFENTCFVFSQHFTSTLSLSTKRGNCFFLIYIN